jgi:hypothetical protein
MISRPSYGVVFAPLATVQNSGARWLSYLQLPDMTANLIPEIARSSLNMQQACLYDIDLTSNRTIVNKHGALLESIFQICHAYRPVLTRFNKQKALIIEDIDRIQDGVMKLVKTSRKEKTKRDAPLDFVSSIGKGLFGFAKHSHLEALYNNVANLQSAVNSSIGKMIRNQELMESVIELTDERITLAQSAIADSQRQINKIVTDMHGLADFVRRKLAASVQENDLLHQVIRMQSKLTANIMRRSISQVNALQEMRNKLIIYRDGVQTLLEGNLPMSLMSPNQLATLIEQIQYELMKTHPEFQVAVKNLKYYYQHPIKLVLNEEKLVIMMKIPLSTSASTFLLYRTHSIKIPLSGVSTDTPDKYSYTKINGIPPYYAISVDGQYYLEMDSFDMTQCTGSSNYKVCEPFMIQVSFKKESCATALYKDQAKQVNKWCQIDYYEEAKPLTELVPLGKGKVLMSTTSQQWAMVCSKMAPQIIEQCRFCVVELGCSCSLRSEHYLIPPSLENCKDVNNQQVVKYPLNALVLMNMLEDQSTYNVSGETVMTAEPDIKLPEIKVQQLDNNDVAKRDQEIAMDFKKILGKMKANHDIYLSKADMIKAKETGLQKIISSDYSDILGLGLALCQVAGVIFMIYTYYRVNQAAGLFAMSKAVTAWNIGPDVKDPTGNSLSTDTPWQLIAYLTLVLPLSLCLVILLKKFIEKLYHKALIRKDIRVDSIPYYVKDSCNLYLVIMDNNNSETLYLGSIQASYIRLLVTRDLEDVRVRLVSRWYKARSVIHIDWRQIRMKIGAAGNSFKLPNTAPVPLGHTKYVKNILSNQASCRILAGRSGVYLEPQVTRELMASSGQNQTPQ